MQVLPQPRHEPLHDALSSLRLLLCCAEAWPFDAPRYSWGNRPDFNVLDEPLYGHYLRVTGAPRPYREEVCSHTL